MKDKILTITLTLDIRKEFVEQEMPALIARVLSNNQSLESEEAENLLFNEILPQQFIQELKARTIAPLRQALQFVDNNIVDYAEILFDNNAKCEVSYIDDLEVSEPEIENP